MNDINKSFKKGILKYDECTHKMFEMEKIIPPPIRKNDKYGEYDWDTRDMNYKEYFYPQGSQGQPSHSDT